MDVARHQDDRKGRTYTVLVVAFLLLLTYGSLVPFDFKPMPAGQAWRAFQGMDLSLQNQVSRSDIVANVGLGMILGFLAMGAATREDTRRFRWLIAPAVVAFAAVTAGMLEFAQMFFPVRTPGLNDIIAQTVGAGVGVTAWFAFGNRITYFVRNLWREHVQGKRAIKLLAAYTAALTLYQVLPMDLSVSPHDIFDKYRAGRITVVPFSDLTRHSLYTLVVHAAVMVPVGYLAALLLYRRRHLLRDGIIAGVLFAAALECLQVLVMSRYASTTDVMLGALGVAVGVTLGRQFGAIHRDHPPRQMLLARPRKQIVAASSIVWIAAVVWQRWSPFEFAMPAGDTLTFAWDSLRPPFYYLYHSSPLNAFEQIVRNFMVFFVLAMQLCGLVRIVRGGDRIVTIILCVVLSTVLEAGQLFLPTRVPDVTTVLINAAGVVTGVMIYSNLAVMMSARVQDSDA